MNDRPSEICAVRGVVLAESEELNDAKSEGALASIRCPKSRSGTSTRGPKCVSGLLREGYDTEVGCRLPYFVDKGVVHQRYGAVR